MSRPGDRVRRAAMRFCSERTRRRLIDPAVADLQAEVAAARRTGSSWHALRAVIAGYVSVVKVLVIAMGGELRQSATTWDRDEAAGAKRGALISAAPLAIVGLIVALAFSGPWTRRQLTAVAGGVFAAHYALWMSSRTLAELGFVRPVVLEWAGPALCVAAAAFLSIWKRSPARRLA